MTLGEAIRDYIQSISINLAAGSVKAYRSRLLFVSRELGKRKLSNVTRSDLERVIISYRKGRKPATVALMVAALHGLFNWCVDEGLLEQSPAARIKAPPRGNHLPRGVSKATTRRIDDVCMDALRSDDWRDVRNATLVLLMRYTGIRRAEAQGLTWRDVDMQGSMLTVLGKGNKERRIPMHGSVFAALSRLGTLRGRKGHVFARDDGEPLSLTSINQVVFDEWLCPRIEEHITPHQLRHTVATLLVERGAQLDEVGALLGHESVATTQVYVECSPERLREAIGRL
jgi:integrase/recombinase XerC